MHSITDCILNEVDLRNLNLSINWYCLSREMLSLLADKLYTYYLKGINDDFVIYCTYSHFPKDCSINLNKFCNLVNNITPNDHMMFSILGYIRNDKVYNKTSLLKLLDASRKNHSTKIKVQFKDESEKITINEAKDYVFDLLAKQSYYLGVPEGPDLEIDIYIFQNENTFSVEYRVSILGYCLNFEFNQQIESWIKSLEEIQNFIPARNASISYDAFPNVHKKYHCSNDFFISKDDLSEYLLSYEWGMFIPVEIFQKLGGEERAQRILVNPIIKYQQNMVWIFYNKPIEKIDMEDKTRLKDFYNKLLLPGFYMTNFSEIRKYGEILIEDDENISIYVEPYIKKKYPNSNLYRIDNYDILFKHGKYGMDEDYKSFYGI